MECVYNGKRFLRLQWSGDGFHSQCISAIFIRWSVVGFCLCSYQDMICFNVAAVMNPEFLSALRRKLRSPQPRGNFLVCGDTHFQNSLFSQDVYEWVLFALIVTAIAVSPLDSEGWAGVGSPPVGIPSMVCIVKRKLWQNFSLIILFHFSLQLSDQLHTQQRRLCFF